MQWPAQEQMISVARQLFSAAGGYFVGRGFITGEQLVILLGLIPPIISAVYSFRASNPAEQGKVGAAKAPETTMTKLVEAAPQVAMDKVTMMPGVKAIVATDRYAEANPNPNVISATEAKATL